MTRIEFEADLLKDEKIEREEEVRWEIVARKSQNLSQEQVRKILKIFDNNKKLSV